RMRDGNFVTESAVTQDADTLRLGAEIAFVGPAPFTVSAPQPGIDDLEVPDFHAGCLRPHSDNATHDLVPRRAGKNHTALGQIQSLAAAHVVVAVPEMDV